MKKKVAIILLIFLAIAAASMSTNPQKIELFNNPLPSSTPFSNSIDINYNGKKITASWFEMDKDQTISLVPNFTEKDSASDIFRKNNCAGLINGGFYSPENSPIGLFVSNERKISNYQNNLLFNGFLKFSKNNASITSDPAVGNFDIILQTGPILFKNGSANNLAIRNDSYDRRMVAGVTNDKAIFIAFYERRSVFNGPYLADLPMLLSEFSRATKIKIVDAINLDGGSASAFYTSNFSLSEISPVGSAFCIRSSVIK